MDAAPPTSLGTSLGAVVLAGGTGRRLGGADKAALRLDGVTLLDRALHAVASAHAVVVVGPTDPHRPAPSRPVTWTREDPPGGGPAAGLLAGLDALGAPAGGPDLVCVLAVDMPRVTAATVGRLVAALAGPGLDGAVLVDAEGRRQPLCAVYRRAALQRVRPAEAHGTPVRRLLDGLRLVEVAAVGDEAHDVDTWQDLLR